MPKGNTNRSGSRLLHGSVLAWCAVLLFSLLVHPRLEGQTKPTEYDVEAVYLLNFGKFLHQPSVKPPGDFDICVLGKDPFGPALDRITAHEQVDARAVRVVRTTAVSESRHCDILFLSASEAPRMDEDLAALAGANVLTVSDMPRFSQHGGMIQFVLQQSKVRFTVNLAAVSHTQLSLSSELLKVALSVTGGPGQEGKP